jgi:hypothetical protein
VECLLCHSHVINLVSKQEDNYHNVGFVIVVGDSQQQTTLCPDSSSPDANGGMSYKHHKSVTTINDEWC